MEAPKNSVQPKPGDTSTADIPMNSFQKPSSVTKVPSVKESGKYPETGGIKTPGPND